MVDFSNLARGNDMSRIAEPEVVVVSTDNNPFVAQSAVRPANGGNDIAYRFASRFDLF
jgi:hypothetical protein